ncbi:MAG: methionyl-tRNA formyltransferase [Alphaproteobacteria bacterium]|nr:methionyl-tRNA formyltransferase [Alphaproteobacteria bacterium]
MRIAFMGTPDFAAAALQALIDSPHEVVCAYSQPPRPKGRGHKVQKSPVHELAETRNIPVFTPQNFKDSETKDAFKSHEVDVAIVAAYGLILPKDVLEIPTYGCLNIHGSLLPRWRGASPIQRAIWAGDEKTGVTIMQMDEGLDTGDMLARCEIEIGGTMTAITLHDALAQMGAALTLEVLNDIEKLEPEPQDSSQSTYASLLKKEDGKIDWKQTAEQIDRQIRALNPWPGVWTTHMDKRFKIHEAVIIPETHNQMVGKVLNLEGNIACGENTVLRLTSVQPEGKNRMDFGSAVNGGYILPDGHFE